MSAADLGVLSTSGKFYIDVIRYPCSSLLSLAQREFSTAKLIEFFKTLYPNYLKELTGIFLYST